MMSYDMSIPTAVPEHNAEDVSYDSSQHRSKDTILLALACCIDSGGIRSISVRKVQALHMYKYSMHAVRIIELLAQDRFLSNEVWDT